MATQEETKLHLFLQWLQVNGVELRGCQIKYCDSNKGFGLFSTSTASDEVLLVVPLNLAITPMRVLDDPLMGPICRAMLKEGEVDDRFLIILFLIVERLRSKSSWKPYLDMIPHSFGTPLWFTDSEFHELKGTTIYQATILQKKSLHAVFEDKVKDLVKQLLILDGESESEVAFEDFLWANSVFWTRALNIPLPRTFVFPEGQQGSSDHLSNLSYDSKTSCNPSSFQEVAKKADKSDTECEKPNISSVVNGVLNFVEAETLWVEGLVPGIDFCNHALKAAATWEVDSTGSAIGVPFSMYLQSVNQGPPGIEKEITISYGNKGNEELLYLYGFVIEDNPDDFLMVHYPAEAVQSVPFSDSKTQLLQAQNAELRCLLPKRLLDRGFFPSLSNGSKSIEERPSNKIPNYSWSGQRTIPSYVDKLVFPEEFLTSLRTVAMQENELFKVQSLLEELVGTEGERELSDGEVRAAVWEACGDAGAFQLLVDMLNSKLIDLEEGSGTEESDSELLNKTCVQDSTALPISADKEDFSVGEAISKNRWASIVYRRGQKQLARLFLREAEQALQLCLEEEC